MHLHLHEAVFKNQDPDLVYSHLVQTERADRMGLRMSKADLDSDHELVHEHPAVSYMS